ncbi:MAG: hypothetical protein HY422_03045 [Candidatus Komeilibacteria bacterium]|nr:hypothetical protein [Candidatus Komeilibacteria bacterium]
MKIISSPISIAELRGIAQESFGDMVKAVADIEKKIMVIGGELHADGEAFLLDKGSKQNNLWGINIYPDQPRDAWIEFDSMINIRPSQNNRSRTVEDRRIREQITSIVNDLIN